MKFEIYKDESDDFRWRLKSANGRIIADSAEGYRNKAACIRGITLMKRCHGAKTVTVDE